MTAITAVSLNNSIHAHRLHLINSTVVMILHISFLRRFASLRRREQKVKAANAQSSKSKQEKKKKKPPKKEQLKEGHT